MLYEFIALHRDEIIDRCRTKVGSRSALPIGRAEVDHGVPVFLDQLADALRLGPISTADEMRESAVLHGRDLLLQGFTVSQVVHDYGDVCQAITELAVETNASITADDFRNLNRCLDDAIAGAVTEHGRERDPASAGEAAGPSDPLTKAARDLRTSIRTAVRAFEVIKSGNVGVAGSTGKVLDRSLASVDGILDRLLVEARGGQWDARPATLPHKPTAS